MLSTLTIRNVVLIDHLELAFRPGLCALTGETGAGKSILLDALGLALGSRADARLVRRGAEQAVVSARFDLSPGHPAFALLAEQGLEASTDGVVVRRVLTADGRSRAFINDQAVGVALLRRVGDTLVEIHGQFESQRLLDPATHRELLDAYGGLLPLVEATASARRLWRQAADARAAAVGEWEAARRDEAFLRHAADELASMDPHPGEEAELARRRTLLINAEKLVQALDEAARELGGGGGRSSVDTALRAAVRLLQRVAERADGRFDNVLTSLERAASEVEEAQALLQRAATDMDLDPRRLEELEERLFTLRGLARKHGCGVEDLCELRETIAARLAAIDDGSGRLARLTQEEGEARQHYREAASRLSAARKDAARRLDTAVASELEPLRLGKAVFQTGIEDIGEADWGDRGWDRVSFAVTTNPGTPAGPLHRIASGGELARFMLALKVVLARADPVPTLIFDEVDAGIGGAVAAAVGDRLARLASDVQVLVVTHSPQVAARASNHWRVSKTIGSEESRTSVDALGAADRKEEIARMLAGARVTEEARAAAGSLLQDTPP
jgi:DNA repair protein RecN (Recombination protein N)